VRALSAAQGVQTTERKSSPFVSTTQNASGCVGFCEAEVHALHERVEARAPNIGKRDSLVA
jgi:hypothetical protein